MKPKIHNVVAILIFVLLFCSSELALLLYEYYVPAAIGVAAMLFGVYLFGRHRQEMGAIEFRLEELRIQLEFQKRDMACKSSHLSRSIHSS